MSDLTLIITSPCGNHSWHQRAPAIPPMGTDITCRDPKGNILFCGTVANIHTEVREGYHLYEGEPVESTKHSLKGMIVSVWLDEIEDTE